MSDAKWTDADIAECYDKLAPILIGDLARLDGTIAILADITVGEVHDAIERHTAKRAESEAKPEPEERICAQCEKPIPLGALFYACGTGYSICRECWKWFGDRREALADEEATVTMNRLAPERKPKEPEPAFKVGNRVMVKYSNIWRPGIITKIHEYTNVAPTYRVWLDGEVEDIGDFAPETITLIDESQPAPPTDEAIKTCGHCGNVINLRDDNAHYLSSIGYLCETCFPGKGTALPSDEEIVKEYLNRYNEAFGRGGAEDRLVVYDAINATRTALTRNSSGFIDVVGAINRVLAKAVNSETTGD